eukprot:5356626-Pleurochrysis_carterae.AAC.1
MSGPPPPRPLPALDQAQPRRLPTIRSSSPLSSNTPWPSPLHTCSTALKRVPLARVLAARPVSPPPCGRERIPRLRAVTHHEPCRRRLCRQRARDA